MMAQDSPLRGLWRAVRRGLAHVNRLLAEGDDPSDMVFQARPSNLTRSQDRERVVDVIDEGLGKIRVRVARWAAFDVGGVAALLLHLVQAKNASLDRRPGQKIDQPARRDAAPLRMRLGGVGELARRPFA